MSRDTPLFAPLIVLRSWGSLWLRQQRWSGWGACKSLANLTNQAQKKRHQAHSTKPALPARSPQVQAGPRTQLRTTLHGCVSACLGGSTAVSTSSIAALRRRQQLMLCTYCSVLDHRQHAHVRCVWSRTLEGPSPSPCMLGQSKRPLGAQNKARPGRQYANTPIPLHPELDSYWRRGNFPSQCGFRGLRRIWPKLGASS